MNDGIVEDTPRLCNPCVHDLRGIMAGRGHMMGMWGEWKMGI